MQTQIPAGTGEKMQYLVHEYNDNTIRFVLHYPGHPDPYVLRDAAKKLIEQADVLHGSFYPTAHKAYWEIHSEYAESSYFQHIKMKEDPFEAAKNLSLAPIAPDDPTQLRCCLVENETESAVILTISHLCADGSDGIYLLRKLTECYNRILTTGTADLLDFKTGSRAPEQIYKGMHPRDFYSLLKFPDVKVKSEFPFPDPTPGTPMMLRVCIPAETMDAARQRAKAVHATANDLLLAAVYHAYAALPCIDAAAPIGVMSMVDLRRHCKSKAPEGLCNLSGTLPTAMPQGICSSFPETLAEIAAQTRKAKENPLTGMVGLPLVHGAARMLPMWFLEKAAKIIYGSFSLGITNLGNIDCKTLALGTCIPTEGIFGGPLKKKPGMQISAASFDNACSLSIFGNYTNQDSILLQKLLDIIAEEIISYALREEK